MLSGFDDPDPAALVAAPSCRDTVLLPSTSTASPCRVCRQVVVHGGRPSRGYSLFGGLLSQDLQNVFGIFTYRHAKWRPARFVLRYFVGAATDELQRGLPSVFPRCMMEWRVAKFVLRLDVGAACDEFYQRLPSVAMRCIVERRPTIVCLRFEVGAACNEFHQYLPSVAIRRIVERRLTFAVLRPQCRRRAQ